MTTNGNNKAKIAGVLGGMGPDATVDFLAKVVAATPAAGDQDHIHMIIDHNPTVPNRHAAIAGTAPGVGPQLCDMASRLESAGADFLVMVCNTAHAYTHEIRAAVKIPFVSIIELVVEELRSHPVRRVGVMAADGCLRAELYQNALARAGFEAVLWDEKELAHFMELIYRIKAGEQDADIGSGIRRLAADLEFRGADLLIAGCTEVPLFLNGQDTSVPLICSTDLLVKRTIALARNQPVKGSSL